MKILLTGAGGQLGKTFTRMALPSGVTLIALGRDSLDLTRPELIPGIMARLAPDVVINAAAYTAVDGAEHQPDLAFAVNRDGARALAKAARAHGAPILHVSTDYIFDGLKPGGWTEHDQPAPLNVYGASKLAGEEAVAEANDQHLIVRVSWLCGAHGKNFLRTILRLGRERDRLRIVDDQWGRPTFTTDAARAMLTMASHALSGNTAWGVYHFSNSGDPVTWRGLAEAIFALAASWSGARPVIEPVTSAAYGAPAVRPRNSVLDLAKIRRVFGISPRPWRAALSDDLDEIRRRGAAGERKAS